MIEKISKVDVYNDDTGFVENYDFSRANMSYESRVNAITSIASVCYHNPKAVDSVKLYDRLATENKGLPSSSYEFVPVLLEPGHMHTIGSIKGSTTNLDVIKYGEFIPHDNLDGQPYLLTNLRALISDVGDDADQFYNTEGECRIIAQYFKVFKWKIPIFVARQAMRHRASWQELSRRYVSGKRAELEFYTSPKMSQIDSEHYVDTYGKYVNTKELIGMIVNHYNQALESGIKPEEARQILPVSLYTTVWSAWQPKQLEVFYKLRCDSHAQREIRDLAEAMKEL